MPTTHMKKLARRKNIENVEGREQRKPSWFRESVVLVSSLALLGGGCAPAKKPVHPSADRKGKAAFLCSKSFKKMSVQSLIEALKDKNTQECAVKTLVDRGESVVPPVARALARLLARLHKRLYKKVPAGAERKGDLNLADGGFKVLKIVATANPSIMFYVLAVFGKEVPHPPISMMNSKIVSGFRKELKNRKVKTRRVAAKMLEGFARGNPGNKELLKSFPSLIRALNDNDASVRRYAADALGRIKDTRALPALRRLMKNDPNSQVRNAAAKAITSILGK